MSENATPTNDTQATSTEVEKIDTPSMMAWKQAHKTASETSFESLLYGLNDAKRDGHVNGYTRKDGTILGGTNVGSDLYTDGRFNSKPLGDTKANLAKPEAKGGAGLASAFKAADAKGKEYLKTLDATATAIAFAVKVHQDSQYREQQVAALSANGLRITERKFTQKELLAQRDKIVKEKQELEAQNAELLEKYEQLKLQLEG